MVTFLLVACGKGGAPAPPPQPSNPCLVNGIDTCTASKVIKATINLNQAFQTMHSFGASDCWTIKYIGKNWPEAKRNEIADLLFSKSFDANGNPKGIGLSMWRSNIGAGSFEQGVASNISSDWRREECYLNSNGTYDWTKQSGNRWFIKAAKDRGVENTLLFSISPPVSMTKNGYAFGPDGVEKSKLNLAAGKTDAFADFLTEVVKHYNQDGLSVNYLSPVNEPQWDWTASSGKASQEGSAATNQELTTLIKAIDQKITSKTLSVKQAVVEAAALNFLYQTVTDNPLRSDVVNYFWNSTSSGYIGNLPSMEKAMLGHSYFSQPTVSSLVSNRVSLQNRINAVNSSLSFWQSEYCILSGEDNTAGNGRDLGIESALYIARVIHTDLALANAASWSWWLAVSPADYKDGLVYVSDLSGNMGELEATKSSGIVYKSKMLWAVGNYSRFIRPGMKRVSASLDSYSSPEDAARNVMISTYKDEVNKQVVIVLVNMTTASQNINLTGVNFVSGSVKSYTTSSSKDLSFSSVADISKIAVEGKSIITLVGSYQ
ncbi:MAG TPA: glycoside hydrolase [Niastella sp.]